MFGSGQYLKPTNYLQFKTNLNSKNSPLSLTLIILTEIFLPAAMKVAPATSGDKLSLSQMTSRTGTKKSSQMAPNAKIR